MKDDACKPRKKKVTTIKHKKDCGQFRLKFFVEYFLEFSSPLNCGSAYAMFFRFLDSGKPKIN